MLRVDATFFAHDYENVLRLTSYVNCVGSCNDRASVLFWIWRRGRRFAMGAGECGMGMRLGRRWGLGLAFEVACAIGYIDSMNRYSATFDTSLEY